MFHPRVLALALIYSGSVGAAYALAYWQPQMVKAFGLTNLQTGFVNGVPFGNGARQLAPSSDGHCPVTGRMTTGQSVRLTFGAPDVRTVNVTTRMQ